VSALAVIICRTSGELGLIRGLGGNELMVILGIHGMQGVVVLDMGQRRGRRDESEGQKGGIGWVSCQQWCLGGHIRW